MANKKIKDCHHLGGSLYMSDKYEKEEKRFFRNGIVVFLVLGLLVIALAILCELQHTTIQEQQKVISRYHLIAEPRE